MPSESQPSAPPLTTAELQDLERLEAEATPGDWTVAETKCDGGDHVFERAIVTSYRDGHLGCPLRIAYEITTILPVNGKSPARGIQFRPEDAAFISRFRNSARRLIAAAREAERLRADLSAARALNQEAAEAIERLAPVSVTTPRAEAEYLALASRLRSASSPSGTETKGNE